MMINDWFNFRISNSLHGSKFSVKLISILKREVDITIKNNSTDRELSDSVFGNVLERWRVLDITKKILTNPPMKYISQNSLRRTIDKTFASNYLSTKWYPFCLVYKANCYPLAKNLILLCLFLLLVQLCVNQSKLSFFSMFFSLKFGQNFSSITFHLV